MKAKMPCAWLGLKPRKTTAQNQTRQKIQNRIWGRRAKEE
jgi:hypothetical protein